jgi:hypothetical protein
MGFALEDRDPVAGLLQFVAARQAGEATAEDDDVLLHEGLAR